MTDIPLPDVTASQRSVTIDLLLVRLSFSQMSKLGLCWLLTCLKAEAWWEEQRKCRFVLLPELSCSAFPVTLRPPPCSLPWDSVPGALQH